MFWGPTYRSTDIFVSGAAADVVVVVVVLVVGFVGEEAGEATGGTALATVALGWFVANNATKERKLARTRIARKSTSLTGSYR